MFYSEAEDARTTELALAAAAGEKDAFERFVRATQRDVWRFIAHLAGVGSADDLAQETFLRALRGVRGFAGRSSARTWLLSIAKRVVVDQIRSERTRPRASRADVDWTTIAERAQLDRRGAGFEDLVETNLLLDELSEDRRAALVLTQLLGLPYEQAADVCGCEVGTIRSRVARAREDLVAHTRGLSAGTG
ncbi:sigma-70 family RNA polymerase sigma factor [Parasphingorhabdus pacifica]